MIACVRSGHKSLKLDNTNYQIVGSDVLVNIWAWKTWFGEYIEPFYNIQVESVNGFTVYRSSSLSHSDGDLDSCMHFHLGAICVPNQTHTIPFTAFGHLAQWYLINLVEMFHTARLFIRNEWLPVHKQNVAVTDKLALHSK